jgi:predicted DCC family thiol-disulfide oxidoreductase YuxK
MLHPIILYDGVCGLCHRLNQFVLRRDREGIFRFASLQSPLAARILARDGANPQDLDTVYVVLNHDLTKQAQPDERLLRRSDAVIFVLKRLDGIWKVLGLFVQLLPRFLRDWGYRVVTSNPDRSRRSCRPPLLVGLPQTLPNPLRSTADL